MVNVVSLSYRPFTRLAVVYGGELYREYLPLFNKKVEDVLKHPYLSFITHMGRNVLCPFDEDSTVGDLI